MRLLASLAVLACTSTAALAQSPQLLLDITPGAAGTSFQGAVDVAGTLFFIVRSTTGDTLWRSDGTSLGTVPVHTFAAGTAYAGELTEFNGKLLLLANDAAHGTEPWISDGTSSGTQLLFDVYPGPLTSSPREITVVGGTAYFVATDAVYGQTLWRTDGTAAGTAVADPVDPEMIDCDPFALHDLGDVLVFIRQKTGIDQTDYWRSDGTAAGTERVALTNGWGEVGTPFIKSIVSAGKLYLPRYTYAEGRELWVTDGTAAGTHVVADLSPGIGSSFPSDFTATETGIYFHARVFGVSHLWHTDGTAAGTQMVRSGWSGSGVAVGSGHVLPGSDGVSGFDLWFTDGTTTGTVGIADLMVGQGPSVAPRLTAVGKRHAYFTATSGTPAVNQSELWITDGTTAGTLMFDVNAGATQSSVVNATFLIEAGGVLFAVLNDGVHGNELFVARPGAAVSSIGLGCSTPNGAQRLDSDDPVLGSSAAVRGEGSTIGGTALLFVGLQSAALPLVPGCVAYIDLMTLQLLASVPTAGDSWSTNVNVPANAALDGLKVVLQAAHVPAPNALGYDVTNALIWVLGN